MPRPPVLAAPVPESRILPSHRVPSFLSYLLRQVCLGIMAEVLAPADLRPVEYATLTTLDAEPGIDQRQLAVHHFAVQDAQRVEFGLADRGRRLDRDPDVAVVGRRRTEIERDRANGCSHHERAG